MLKPDQIFDQMVLNAIDFLRQASAEAEASPKYAVLHLATAIEIVLKARIVAEHWSIIVKRDVSRDRFMSGDFVSLSLKDSISVMKDVIGIPLKAKCEASFISLSNHRNRIVHFFSHNLTESVSGNRDDAIQEILVAIYYLSDFIKQHQQTFVEHQKQLDSAISQVKRARAFLEAKYLDLKPQLDSARTKGSKIVSCAVCSYDSAVCVQYLGAVYSLNCAVCENSDHLISVECPNECGLPIRYLASDAFQIRDCECGVSIDQADLVKLLDQSDPFDMDAGTIYCNYCGSDSVAEHEAHYLCCECFSMKESYSVCDWCNQKQLTDSDLEGSGWSGCEYCDGRSGWDKD
jgi:hypothetical protein